MSNSIPSSVYCGRCRATLPIPTQIPRDRLLELAAPPGLSTIALMDALRKATEMSISDAKSLAQHVTNDGTCHHCHAAIPTEAIHTCHCRAVNVNLALLK